MKFLIKGQTKFSWRRISQSEIRNLAAAKSKGGQKFLPPQPPSFLPARAFSLAREARRQFRSKKVRTSSNKRTPLENSQNHQEAFVTPKRQIPSSYFHHLVNFLTGWAGRDSNPRRPRADRFTVCCV